MMSLSALSEHYQACLEYRRRVPADEIDSREQADADVMRALAALEVALLERLVH